MDDGGAGVIVSADEPTLAGSGASTPGGGDELVSAILAYLAERDLLPNVDVRRMLERELDAIGPTQLVRLRIRLAMDKGWDYHPPDPLVRRIHDLLAGRILGPASVLDGAGHLDAVAGLPVILLANHLSFADANLIQMLLHRGGVGSLAGRLTALAGPKVFSSRERRFSSLCFGTIKVPQSTEVASGEALLPAREVARAARQVMAVASRRLALGDALLLFGEGTRSRNASMGPMLAAVARYFEAPDVRIVPLALSGSEAVLPVADAAPSPARVCLRAGEPIHARGLLDAAAGQRQRAMDAIGLAIAGLLPPAYRGVYSDRDRYPEASRILAGL